MLQAALESSVTGVLDVSALIESTMTLTDRPMIRPPAGASESNTLECPLKDLPDGVKKAEVWIGPANGPDGLRALSLRIQLARKVRPYVVGGVAREDPELDLTIISDQAGKARECRILTRLQASNQGSDQIEGVACLFDATGTGRTSLSFLGTKDHRTRQWEGPISLVGSDPAARWTQLQDSLWNRFQEIRK